MLKHALKLFTHNSTFIIHNFIHYPYYLNLCHKFYIKNSVFYYPLKLVNSYVCTTKKITQNVFK
jgi:hypothetical protein